MGPFGYGEEFFRLNDDAFTAYSQCVSGEEVQFQSQEFIRSIEMRLSEKVRSKELSNKCSEGYGKTGSYLNESDLPPLIDEYANDEDDYEDEEEKKI